MPESNRPDHVLPPHKTPTELYNAALKKAQADDLEKLHADLAEAELKAVTPLCNPFDAKGPTPEEVLKAVTQLGPARGTPIDKTDPWKHRSTDMVCGCCMFFVEKVAPGNERRVGRCRRHAPTMAGYPAVFIDDWCGDHKVDERMMN